MAEGDRPYNASQGWTLQEAIERTADPTLWEQWIGARHAIPPPVPMPNELKTRGWASPIFDCDLIDRQRRRQAIWRDAVHERRRPLIEVESASWKALLEAFRGKLLAGNLAAKASRGGASVASTDIEPHSWSGVRFLSFEKSIAVERMGDKAKLFNVRIFPPIHAGNATTRLNGLSLSEAFSQFILADPEVIAAGRRVTLKEPRQDYIAVFNTGRAPGPTIKFVWSLDSPPRDLAFNFVRRLAYFVDDPIPVPSHDIVAASTILMDRLSALKKLLVSGRIVARGTFAASGQIVLIDRLQWAREGILIDVRNSDVLRYEQNHLAPLWTGVVLELPIHNEMLNVIPIPPPIAHPPRRRSVKRVETTTIAVKECKAWLIEHMKRSPDRRTKTKANWFAEAKTKWPHGLSERAFEKIWSDAISEAHAPAWSAAGAPKKNRPRFQE